MHCAYDVWESQEYISEYGTSYVILLQSKVLKSWHITWHLYEKRHLVKYLF